MSVCGPCQREGHEDCLDGEKYREEAESKSFRGEPPPWFGCDCPTCNPEWQP